MKAIVELPVNGNTCGECKLAVFRSNPNGWAWCCQLFDMRLTNRYWQSDCGWKQQKMLNPSTLKRCSECLAATEKGKDVEQH